MSATTLRLITPAIEQIVDQQRLAGTTALILRCGNKSPNYIPAVVVSYPTTLDFANAIKPTDFRERKTIKVAEMAIRH